MESLLQPVEVVLPAGVMEGDKVVTSAQIVPMTGKTRKDIARADVRRDSTKVTETILQNCVKSIGDSPIDRRTFQRLILGDREFLLLQIRKISKGDDVKYSMACGTCEEPFHGTFSITNDVPVYPMPKDVEVLTDESGVSLRTFRVKSDEMAIDAVFRYPFGVDQAEIAKSMRANPVASVYTLLWRCLISLNGSPQMDIPKNIFEEMPLPALDFIQGEFYSHQPGPDFSEPVRCPNCGAENQMVFQSADFFFDPETTRRKRQEKPV